MNTKRGKWWGGGGGGVMNWEIGLDMCTLMCIKLMTNKNLLYNRINKMKFKKHKIAKTNLKKLNEGRGPTFTDFKNYHKATIIKTVWFWHQNKQVDKRNRI